jgi:hypothetical protein
MVMAYQWKALLGGNYSATFGHLVEKHSDRLLEGILHCIWQTGRERCRCSPCLSKSSKHTQPPNA